MAGRRPDQSALFKITSAAIIPGIHPNNVSTQTIRKEPQPLSTTESGGNNMASIALRSDILTVFLYKNRKLF